MQNDLKIYYPCKPFFVTQPWGVENPIYRAQFNNPDFYKHNGVDVISRDTPGKQEFPIYCPVEGFSVWQIRHSPNGGGNELWLISDEPLQMFERKAHALLCFFHGKKILVKVGDRPALGALLMISDSTGFSTGNHLHMGLYRIQVVGGSFSYLDVGNGANGSFDPAHFYTVKYAVDVATSATLVKSGLRYLAYLLSF